MKCNRPTELSVLNSTTHGRQRRQERKIEKIELQRARRYGMVENSRRGRLKYTYGGVIFIYDPKRKCEVTSFPSSDVSSSTSGTRVTKPIIIPKIGKFNRKRLAAREEKRQALLENKASWSSHSVLVVDMSGSMRRDDVNGARCRSDGIWMSLARDYVKKPLDKKSRSEKDLISIIVMKETSHILLEYEPTDWVLYNKLIDMRDWTSLRPSGHGNYLPALDAAEDLLLTNSLGSCALSLLFFSDGKPSDQGIVDFSGRMGAIASKFGRRLSFVCIGMAEQSEDFSTLNDMVTEAEAFGSVASFGRPSLDADSLSNIVSSLASSLTTTITEMTNIDTGKSREVRTVRREKLNTPDEIYFNDDDWTAYRNIENENYIAKIWSWDYRFDDFVQYIDPRCSLCWEETNALNLEDGDLCKGILCPECKAHCFCTSCYNNGSSTIDYTECTKYLQDRRSGKIVSRVVPRFQVAVKKTYFGEGAERLVCKLRFLGNDDLFIGPIMVAKESRFLEKKAAHGHWQKKKERMSYHSEFMRTQALAAQFGKKFNKALEELVENFKFCNNRIYLQKQINEIPRIEFLEPMVIETIDPIKKGIAGAHDILVEPFLEGKYMKFNSNMGMVQGQVKNTKEDIASTEPSSDYLGSQVDNLTNKLSGLDINSKNALGGFDSIGLGAIEEGSEEESEDDEDDFEEVEYSHCVMVEDYTMTHFHGTNTPHNLSTIKEEFVPQAFSHFTFETSKKNLMVVDLQGVLKHNKDGTSVYQLTDPAIHKLKKKKFRRWRFGRTDRGEKGMKAFFRTHECNDLCRLLGLKERRICNEGHLI